MTMRLKKKKKSLICYLFSLVIVWDSPRRSARCDPYAVAELALTFFLARIRIIPGGFSNEQTKKKKPNKTFFFFAV